MREIHRCSPDEVSGGFDYHDVERPSDLGDLIDIVFDLGSGFDLNGSPWREDAGHEIFQAGVYRKDQPMTCARADTPLEALSCALIKALDKEEEAVLGDLPGWPWSC